MTIRKRKIHRLIWQIQLRKQKKTTKITRPLTGRKVLQRAAFPQQERKKTMHFSSVHFLTKKLQKS